MTGDQPANVGLPFPTKAGDHTKRTEQIACVDAYQTLPYLVPVMLKHLVDLDWSTNCYHSPDLALLLSCETFTNHYHRGLGRGIDLAVEGSVVVWATVARVM